jgi:ATP-binding cassette subfamily B protein
MAMHGSGFGSHGRHFSGDLGDEELGKVYDHQVVQGLLSYVRPHWKLSLLAIVMMLAYTSTVVAVPKLVQYAIDSFISSKDASGDLLPGDLTGLNFVGVLFLFVIVVNSISNFIYLRALAKISQEVLYSLRVGMFDHLQRQSLSFFDRIEVGRVMSRVQNDVLQLQEFLSIVVITLGDALSLLGIVTVMLLMNWKLALVTFVVIPVLIVVLMVWQRFARTAYLRVRAAIAVVNAGLQENISGVRVIQSLNREDVNLRRFDRVNYEHLDANLHATRMSAILMPTVETLTAIAFGLVVVIGGNMVIGGTLKTGEMIAFALFVQRFFDPIRNLTMQYTQMQRAMTSGVRIFELLQVQPTITDAPNANDLPPMQGHVCFEHVSFSYNPSVEVLLDISLDIQPGQTLAIVGPTGAGKSSLVSLLERFYDVTDGRITIDGYDIRNVTRASLARQMGMVLQEPFLFSATVRDNIRYHHQEATDEEIQQSTRALGAHDFITRLPQGYDTVLHERGSNLSMGQRQLIAFARALVANPRILILDEATANIDTYTESIIQRALKKLLHGRTSIVIAHRLSTIRDADQIIVLDQGYLVEQGTHQTLLQRSGLYAKLHAMNFQDVELHAIDG